MTNSTALRTEASATSSLVFAPTLRTVVAPRAGFSGQTVPSDAELFAAVYGAGNGQRAQPAANRELSPAIYRRRQIAAGLALVLVGALLWTALSVITGVGGAPVGADLARQPEPTIHVVQPGDTLWTIAGTIDADGDVRDTVDRLADVNGGSALEVGQRLVID